MDTLDRPLRRLLDVSLIAAPVCYLALDSAYAVRGWWDGWTGAAQVLAAVLYGVAAIKLVTLTRGRTQLVLLVVALLGLAGNAGVGENTVHIALGGNDLFMEDGPANLFKTIGFFFPLTFLVAAVGLRRRTPTWWPPLLALGAVLFPVAHVVNISWLAIVDALVMLVALGSLERVLRPDEAARPSEESRPPAESRPAPRRTDPARSSGA